MKKNLFLAMIVSLALVSCDKEPYVSVPFVEHEKFGVITFETDQTWKITNGTITQEWSDAVTATKCQKDTFNGNYADCRSNPAYKGDLFSWEAVNQYKSVLCPNGWRVPDTADFRALDIALGGSGEYRSNDTTISTKYISTWGGSFGRNCDWDGALSSQNIYAFYWSSVQCTVTYPKVRKATSGRSEAGYVLFFNTYSVNPQDYASKSTGSTLRCVR